MLLPTETAPLKIEIKPARRNSENVLMKKVINQAEPVLKHRRTMQATFPQSAQHSLHFAEG